MGYSCTAAAAAAYVEESMMEVLHETTAPEMRNNSNTWDSKGERYFFERGREQDDGAITGVVWQTYEKDGKDYCHRAGSVRIEPDGKITRWSTSNKQQRQRAEKMGKGKYVTHHVIMPTFDPIC